MDSSQVFILTTPVLTPPSSSSSSSSSGATLLSVIDDAGAGMVGVVGSRSVFTDSGADRGSADQPTGDHNADATTHHASPGDSRGARTPLPAALAFTQDDSDMCD